MAPSALTTSTFPTTSIPYSKTTTRKKSSTGLTTSSTNQAPAPHNASHPTFSNDTTKPWIRRKYAFISQSLILFNVYGIPLSFGPYLEYYYNTHYQHATLVQLSAINATRLLCIFGIAWPVEWCYRHGLWRTLSVLAVIGAAGAQIGTIYVRTWWVVVLIQGVGLGLCLGVLLAEGTCCLASHYLNDIPAVSLTAASAGLLGAVVYTGVAWCFLDGKELWRAEWASMGITGGTLGAAVLLLRRDTAFSKRGIARRQRQNPASTPGPWPWSWTPSHPSTYPFLLGTLLLTTTLFIHPTYNILLSASSPGHIWPSSSLRINLFAYILALLTSSITSMPRLRQKIGPLDTLIFSALLGGAALILPAWIPSYPVTAATSLVYGFCLGNILPAYVRAAGVFLEGGEWAGMASLMGVGAAAGIMLVAWVTERGERGFRTGLMVAGMGMVGSGMLMGGARVWRCRRVFVVL
ncbi:hypothetical protein P154DRAFT_79297 [Amniculicola lignicola CBS 123094]|uniref:MFS general substrate transporter n=1 Tax=Amniculicola lignicola CBS 123094 TaxID=1392246 RepID=A0A6A5WPK4_9PLEO|nr:hypothetical protein P154DRAFT_79297 [Amniculicola lignicola CBS 123094]